MTVLIPTWVKSLAEVDSDPRRGSRAWHDPHFGIKSLECLESVQMTVLIPAWVKSLAEVGSVPRRGSRAWCWSKNYFVPPNTSGRRGVDDSSNVCCRSCVRVRAGGS